MISVCVTAMRYVGISTANHENLRQFQGREQKLLSAHISHIAYDIQTDPSSRVIRSSNLEKPSHSIISMNPTLQLAVWILTANLAQSCSCACLHS